MYLSVFIQSCIFRKVNTFTLIHKAKFVFTFLVFIYLETYQLHWNLHWNCYFRWLCHNLDLGSIFGRMWLHFMDLVTPKSILHFNLENITYDLKIVRGITWKNISMWNWITRAAEWAKKGLLNKLLDYKFWGFSSSSQKELWIKGGRSYRFFNRSRAPPKKHNSSSTSHGVNSFTWPNFVNYQASKT